MSRALELVIMDIKSLLQNDGAHSSSHRWGGQYLFLRGCGIKGVRDPKCFVPSESSLSNQVRSTLQESVGLVHGGHLKTDVCK